MRRIITIIAVTLGVGALAAPAMAQTATTTTTVAPTTTTGSTLTTIPVNTPLNGLLTINGATSVAPGAKVKISGAAITPGNAVLTLISEANTAGLPLGTIEVPAAGALADVEVTIPAEATAGTWYIRLVDAGVKIFAAEVTVANEAGATTTKAPTATTAPSDLPNNGPLATLPVILAAAGIGFAGMMLAQRTRKA